MRDLIYIETVNVAAGIWCTYDGKPCSNCANMIQVEGNDCSFIKGSLSVSQSSFDAGGLIFSAGVGWASALVGMAGSRIFGLGLVASGGLGLAFTAIVGAGYALSQVKK